MKANLSAYKLTLPNKTTVMLIRAGIFFSVALAILPSNARANEQVGEISIDGETVPAVLFSYYRQQESKDYMVCPPTDRKEKVIDLLVAVKQYETDTGTKFRDNTTIIAHLHSSLADLPDKPTTNSN